MRLLIALMFVGLLEVSGGALFQPSLRDYVHTAWTQHDGLPLSPNWTPTQTTDGYLWLTTRDEPLLRFDGVRFVPITTPCSTKPIVLSDGGGGLWLFCDYHFIHRDPSGRMQSIPDRLALSSTRPSVRFFVDSRRRLWFWGRSVSYLQPDGKNGPEISGTARKSTDNFCEFAEDSRGDIWFGTREGFLRIHDDVAELVLPGAVFGLGPAASGGIYLLKSDALLKVSAGAIYKLVDIDHSVALSSSEIVETSKGVWFGTDNRGVGLVHDGKTEFFGIAEGLSSLRVTGMVVDKEGDVWASTALGLHRFREPTAYILSPADGMPSGQPQFAFQERGTGLWLGSSRGTVRLDEVSGRRTDFGPGYISVAEDSTGRVWLGTRTDVGYLRGSRFIPVRNQDGASLPRVFSVMQDAKGGMWALSRENGLYKIVEDHAELQIGLSASIRFLVSEHLGIWVGTDDDLVWKQNDRITVFGPQGIFPAGRVLAIQEIGDSIWVGGFQGLWRWRNRTWTGWTAREGLPRQGRVFDIQPDAQGRFWIMSDGGILVVNRSELDETPDAHPSKLNYLRIGTLDRVEVHPGGILAAPRVTVGRDGRLFFATVDSVAVVDPSRVSEKSLAPPIVLETVLVNRKPVPAGAKLFVEPEDVQFEYTSLSLRNAENIRFRYRLGNHDQDWIEAGSQRRASYGALKPGSYRFQVIGSGSEGAWNYTGASYEFRITAPFYKTPLFLFTIVLVIGTLIWFFYRYRLQLASERIRLRLEAQSDERLRIAQNMHDTFLQGIHGVSMTVFAALVKLETQPAEARNLLDRTLEMVETSMDEARQLMGTLRGGPSERGPLLTRLKSLVAAESALYETPPQVSNESTGTVRLLRPPVEEDVYLIASEALRNALRHAQCQNIRITVHFHFDAFLLTISDDGVGIDEDIQRKGRDGHFGLQGMRERAERHPGVLKLCSTAGKGTELTLCIPASEAYSP